MKGFNGKELYNTVTNRIIKTVAESGAVDYQMLFDAHIKNATAEGMMPKAFCIVRKTLSDFGFVMQSTKTENISAAEALARIGTFDVPSIILLQTDKRVFPNWDTAAFNAQNVLELIGAPIDTEQLKYVKVRHCWIYWSDGKDRSPFPRRKRKTEITDGIGYKPHESKGCFNNYQPNPKGRNIGDCVVRALSGVLGIPWEEAVALLATEGDAAINTVRVFATILAKRGFVYHKAILVGGKGLRSAVFCDEMNKTYHNGERIFAFSGRRHAVSILPMDNGRGGKHYMVNDSWNSTENIIGDYWVETVKIEEPKPKPEKIHLTELPRINDRVEHPKFGIGTVKAVDGGIMTVDFGKNGCRRLAGKWLMENCFSVPADETGAE